MPIVYQHDNKGFYAGQCDDYNGPLPHNCVSAAPPALPWDHLWPRWDGKAWELIEDHRARRVEDGFAPEQAQAATNYWLPAAGDDWQSPAREMKEIGPLPQGAVTRQPEQPAPTLEEAKVAKLAEIDSQTSAAILAGFDYSVDGENLHFSYDSFDQQNFADTANACLLAQSGVAGLPESVTWNAYQGETRELVRLTLTATQFLELYTAGALAHKAAKMEVGGRRKQAVEAAQSVEEVEAA